MHQSGRISEEQMEEWYRLFMTHFTIEERLLWQCVGFRSESPLTVANLVRMRQEQQRMFPDLAIRPCDVHVLGLGEPPCRWWTKLGGLPFRPKSQPWPCNAAGEPYDFICQFWVGESADILPPCPAEVLLIFSMDGMIYTPSPAEDDLYFEWQNLDHNLELVQETDCLGKGYQDLIAYGCPYRTLDFIDPFPVRVWVDSVLKEYGKEYSLKLDWDDVARMRHPSGGFETEDDLADDLGLTPWRFGGVKIGGEPCWVHARLTDADESGNLPSGSTRKIWKAELPDADEWGNDYGPTHDEIRMLRFIAGFSGWFPVVDKPWPWINREEPLSFRDLTNGQFINWGDGFRDHFFLDSSGQVRLAHEFNSSFREKE